MVPASRFYRLLAWGNYFWQKCALQVFTLALKLFVDDLVREIFCRQLRFSLSTTSLEKYFVDDFIWETTSLRRKINLKKRAQNENRRAQRDPWHDTGPPTRSFTRNCYAELNRDYSYRWKKHMKNSEADVKQNIYKEFHISFTKSLTVFAYIILI